MGYLGTSSVIFVQLSTMNFVVLILTCAHLGLGLLTSNISYPLKLSTIF